jgi:hypothetical protein
MFDKIARLGVLGFAGIAITILFGFVVVAAFLDVPGLVPFDEESRKTVLTTILNLAVGLGGAAVVVLRDGRGSSDD